MKRTKSVLSFVICALTFICHLGFGTCHLYADQGDNKILSFTKQIMEAKTNEDVYAALEQLTDIYFKENKYNEYIDFLASLTKQRKSLEPALNYYIALTRYYQLKHLEETKSWEEYFDQGNAYREELTGRAQKAIDSLNPTDALGLYARLILWKYYRDQQDALSELILSDLMNRVLPYAQIARNLTPVKDVAAELSSYGEKAKAKELYRLYADKITNSDIKDEELNLIALGFYREGNLDLAEGLYDVYIDRIHKSMPKERLIPVLTDIAKSFAANAGVQGDLAYAEKIFKKIEEIGTKEAFNEELLYVRAFNLEKFGEYLQARDIYIDLVTLYPKSIHADEADFKIGIIYTYIARDLKNGKVYFERLAQKELVSPQVIAGLYQLGLLSQWGQDLTKAKEYYLKLIEKAKNEYPETVGFANERLKEIKESRPIEYNLKVFLDVSLKEEYLALDTTKLDLKAQPLTVKKDEGINFVSRPYIAASGCLHVELQYLWSGDTGKVKPSLAEPAFDTAYTENGTKVVSLVVVSPSGIVDRNIYMTDVISDIPAKN